MMCSLLENILREQVDERTSESVRKRAKKCRRRCHQLSTPLCEYAPILDYR